MASDGFWDHVSNEQAVTLVTRWVAWREAGMPKESTDSVSANTTAKVNRTDAERWEWDEGVLALKDSNVATHLVRNALGGADEEFIQAVFTFDAPRCRNIRYVVSAFVSIADD